MNKLSSRTFRIQWDLHAWAGVVASLLVFVVCFFGVFALFWHSLLVWQDPALHVPEREAPSFDALLGALEAEREIPQGGRIGFWRIEGTRFVPTFLTHKPTGLDETLFVDPEGQVLPERTRVARELYLMHFLYRLPLGLQLTGLVGIAVLALLVSGLLVHWKDLRRQLWSFRPHLRLRFSASDAHKVLGVFGLPFATVMAWSGSIVCLGALLAQGLALTNYGGSVQEVYRLAGEATLARAAEGRAAQGLAPDALIGRAREALGTADAAHYVDLRHHGDAGAWARVFFEEEPFEKERYVLLDGVDGSVIETHATRGTPFGAFEHLLFDVHFAEYGGWLLKILYGLLTLALCAVVVTGNVIWLERRDAGQKRIGNWILARLTAGFTTGAAVASAVILLANRVLPWDLANRADVEFGAMLATWLASTAIAFVPRWTARQVASALAFVAALLFVAVVGVSVATVETHLFTALGRDLPAVFAVELLLLALAAASFALAWALRPARAAIVAPALLPDLPEAADEPVRSSAA